MPWTTAAALSVELPPPVILKKRPEGSARLSSYGTIDASPDGEAYHRERSPAPPADPLSSRPSVP